MKRSIFSFVAFIMLALVMNTSALTWNPFKGEGRVKAHTVILTGNFVDARILAELAQYYTKQPVILSSLDADGSVQLFYLPNSKEAKAVTPEELMELVDFINPKRAVILGNETYVPRSLSDQIRAKYPVISLDSADWAKNAASLSELFEKKEIQKKYTEYANTLKQN